MAGQYRRSPQPPSPPRYCRSQYRRHRQRAHHASQRGKLATAAVHAIVLHAAAAVASAAATNTLMYQYPVWYSKTTSTQHGYNRRRSSPQPTTQSPTGHLLPGSYVTAAVGAVAASNPMLLLAIPVLCLVRPKDNLSILVLSRPLLK